MMSNKKLLCFMPEGNKKLSSKYKTNEIKLITYKNFF